MGIFGGMQKATVFGAGRNPVPGTYIIELSRLLHKPSANPKKKGHNLLIGEHTVLEFTGTTWTSVETGKVTDTSGAFKAGESVSHVIDISDEMYGLANTKEYMAAIWQAYSSQVEDKPITIDEALAFMSTQEGESVAEDLVVGERSKKVKGLILKLEAWAATKSKGAEDFTAKKFSAHSEA